jgi:hypothetical protein
VEEHEHCWHETMEQIKLEKHGPVAPREMNVSYSMRPIKICCHCGEKKESRFPTPHFHGGGKHLCDAISNKEV